MAFVTLLVVAATVTQPLLAVPASCMMPGQDKAMACASCCAVEACCTSLERKDSAPVVADATLSGGFLVALPLQSTALPAPPDHLGGYRNFPRAGRIAHMPEIGRASRR